MTCLLDGRADLRDTGFLLQVLDALPAAAYTCDDRGLITYFNPSAAEFWGRAPRLNHEADRFCGSFRLYRSDGTPIRNDQCWMALTIRDRVPHIGREIVIERPDGTLRWALAHANPLLDAEGRFVGAANVLVDITDRKRIEDRSAYQATHDLLTGLHNRALILEKLEAAIDPAARPAGGAPFALLLMDLNRFKEINDTFGHEYGDEILRLLSPRLLDCVRKSDTVARLGGDEFGILLEGADLGRAVGVAEAIIAGLKRPIVVADRAFDILASIGIAAFPDHGRDATTILKHADVAMYAAKRCRSGPVVYAGDRAATTPHQLSLAGQLRRGIEEGEMVLHYQPKVGLRSMRVEGVEALIRWNHPCEGTVLPGEFLPLAELTGLVKTLDLWTLREALKQSRAWHRAGLEVDMAVNLASQSLQDPATFRAIVETLEAAGAHHGPLTVEVTECGLMDDPARAREHLTRLRSMGIRVSLDDFGTGYSSFTHLRELPVDEIKVDRTFVRELTTNGRDACIVRSIIDLASSLGLKVVAEGVEDRPALDHLSAWGCDLAQGFYFTRALPPDDLLAWAEAQGGDAVGHPCRMREPLFIEAPSIHAVGRG